MSNTTCSKTLISYIVPGVELDFLQLCFNRWQMFCLSAILSGIILRDLLGVVLFTGSSKFDV